MGIVRTILLIMAAISFGLGAIGAGGFTKKWNWDQAGKCLVVAAFLF